MTLTEAANQHGCDKGTEANESHGYTETYASCVPHSGPFKMLEIGVFQGSSVRMWLSYNPVIRLSVVDISQLSLTAFDNSLCEHVYLADQGSRSDLKKIVAENLREPFDIVIDDGSHEMEDQQISLAALFAVLKPGGRYFIEDLHTCHWFVAESRTSEILRSWKVGQPFLSPFLTSQENSNLGNSISDVRFHNSDKLVEIRKRQ